jgi:hypothetical protein
MMFESIGSTAKAAYVAGRNIASGIAGTGEAVSVTATSSTDAVVTLSTKAQAMLAQRHVPEATGEAFKAILAKAQAAGAETDPQGFVQRLSAAERQVLRQVHCLADPIDPAGLSFEGAFNLLREPGASVDLNNNGLTSVGAGNFLAFPPQNAPESFKEAWRKASEGISPMDVPTQMMMNIGLANIHVDPATGAVRSVDPDSPEWVNPYANPGYDYRAEVERIIGGLNYEHQRGLISQPIYDREMAFYRRLSEALA